ncbi:MAG: BlaI/MecI/CopY family transcriptional regulator [Ruminococcaceae bacterium]|nr:BlaI/MecI/CopY family transcriptional regulator [Oscillospiraceae bacterium]
MSSDMKRKKLSEAELEIMIELWGEGKPTTSPCLLRLLSDKRSWRLATLQTVLSRLEEKGYLFCDRSAKANLYSPLVDEKSYKEQASRHFLKKMHRNSISSLVASLYDGGAISNDDLDELKKFIQKTETNERS